MTDVYADYTSPIPVDVLINNGVVGVSRYLSWPHYWDGKTHLEWNPKIIRPPEYAALRGNVDVILNWEYDSEDWMTGAIGGTEHGREAVRQAKELGYPAGSIIAGSADFDMSGSQWDYAGMLYGITYRDAIFEGGYRPGIYGSYDVLQWIHDLIPGYALYWQAGMSTAWSNGRNKNPWPHAHMRQIYQTNLNGQQVDVSEILNPWNKIGDIPMVDSTTQVTVYGGSDMGEPVAPSFHVPIGGSGLSPDPQGQWGNSLVDQLNELRQNVRSVLNAKTVEPGEVADQLIVKGFAALVASEIIRQLGHTT